MSRGKISFCDILKKFKSKAGVKSDYEAAELLHLKQTTLSQRKKRESVPYEELIRYCQQNAVSLDELFNVKKARELDFLNKDERRYASITIAALRNHKTSIAVKANLDVLAGIPNDEDDDFNQPTVNENETITCLACNMPIPNGDVIAHLLESPECDIRDTPPILRINSKQPIIEIAGNNIGSELDH